jgi:hypothetical protein
MNLTRQEITSELKRHGLAEPVKVAFLPINFDRSDLPKDPLYSPLTPKLEEHFSKAGHPIENLGREDDTLVLENRGETLFLPTLACFAPFLVENQALIAIYLNLISSYIYDAFKSVRSVPEVKMRMILRDGEVFESLEYQGPVSALSELVKWKKTRFRQKIKE